MRISDAFGEAKPLDVHYPTGAVLHVFYAPATYSVVELERIQQSEKEPRRILRAVRRLVTSWDLTDNDGAPIGLDEPHYNGMPLSDFIDVCKRNGTPLPDDLPVDPLSLLPTNIFTQILRAVNEDQDPGEARKA